jgi:hypothetical protein
VGLKAVVFILEAWPLLKRSAESPKQHSFPPKGAIIETVANDRFAGAHPTLRVYDEST